MGKVTVILGENGKGKTRFLLSQYEKYKDSKCIATISNSLINPFPLIRDAKHDSYALRARQVYSPNLFARSINNYFDRLLVNANPKILFFILEHVGFDGDFIVRREPMYHVSESGESGESSGISKSSESSESGSFRISFNYQLEPSPTLGENRYSTFTRTMPVAPGFAKEYSKFIGKAEEFHLTYSRHIHQSQNYRDHLEAEKEIAKLLPYAKKRTLFRNKYFFKKNGIFFPLENASSGELYIMSLALFIRRFLHNTEKHGLPRLILIDEPENSLHPKWQREYIGFIKGFIGYDAVDIVIATHSPLIAIDDGNYSEGISLKGIEDGVLVPVRHNENDNNIEQVYYELFGVLTPKNRYLSEYCNDLLKRFAANKISYLKAEGALTAMREASFDSDQQEFLQGVLEILKRLEGKLNG
ncbi:AAA family ATPase [Pantoea agglomerans]|uniref:AAA family ATPase n=1 Tax=Enterobacter agglomerans TaxID=549 RepID=UPI003C7C9C73